MLRSSFEVYIDQFEMYFPDLYKRSVDWWKSGPYHITFLLDDNDRVEFDASENTIRYVREFDRFADSPELRKEVGRNIRKYIVYSGLRQQDISEKIGITDAMLSRYINGNSMPGLDKLRNIAYVLNCQITDLIGDYEK